MKAKQVRRRSAGPPDAAGNGHAGDAIIWTHRLTKRYGTFTAVDRLDLEVRPGEVFGLLGPNGAGKTTTVLMLLGLSEPSEGEARVCGLDPARHPLEVKQRVGYLPDNVGFYGDMTGRENLHFTAALNGFSRSEGQRRVGEMLEQVGLADVADNRVDTYSRGMRQRLGIADALVKGPDVLILDEPTIAIDPAGVAEILSLIRDLVREHGMTVLLSSHLLEQVQHVCDRVGIFLGGRLVARGTVAELARTAPSSSVILEVGADAAADVVDRSLRGLPGVEAVEPHEHDPRLRLVTARPDAAMQLAGRLTAAGLPLFHLESRSDSLEAIYRRLVAQQQGDGHGGGR